MVAISHEGVYTRADVSIANHTDTPLSMTPEDFRVEVLTPKPKVLLYIPPANLVLPPPPLPPAPAAAAPARHHPCSHPPPTPRGLLHRNRNQPSSPNDRRRSALRRSRTKSCPTGSCRKSCRRTLSNRHFDPPQRCHPGPGLLRTRQKISPRQRGPAHSRPCLRIPLCDEALTADDGELVAKTKLAVSHILLAGRDKDRFYSQQDRRSFPGRSFSQLPPASCFSPYVWVEGHWR